MWKKFLFFLFPPTYYEEGIIPGPEGSPFYYTSPPTLSDKERLALFSC